MPRLASRCGIAARRWPEGTVRRVAAAVPGGLLAAFGFLSCAGEADLPGLEPVRHPAIERLEGAAGRQLSVARDTLSELLTTRRPDPRRVAAAFGSLAELYQAYRLEGPAGPCYRNAERLDPGSFSWPYQLGLLELERGQPEAAAAAFSRALKRRPGDPPATLHLGEAHLRLGRLESADESFRTVATEVGFEAAAAFGLGRVALARGEVSAAVEHFERALAQQPEAGEIRHALGLALRALGRTEEALQQLGRGGAGKVAFPDPVADRVRGLAESAGSHLRRGNQALAGGRLEAAVDAFRKAVEADPELVEARRNLALALMRQGETGAATDTLRAAIELGGRRPWLHFDLGNALLADGDPAAAATAFGRAVELAPDLTEARVNLANVLVGLGRWTEAGSHLDAALEADPLHSGARYLAAMAAFQAGDGAAAETALRALLKDDPASSRAWDGLASILAERDRHREAATALERALATATEDAERARLRVRLAEGLWRLGRRQEAIAHARRATEVADSSTARTALANMLQRQGDLAEAADHFARAAELDPANAAAWLSEATLHILQESYAEARARLEAALEHHPADPAIQHTFARLLATCPDPDVRDGRQALTLAQLAYRQRPALEHAETVAMALAELGRFEEAVAWQRGLVERARQNGQERLAERLSKRLASYTSEEKVRIGQGPGSGRGGGAGGAG